MVLTDRQAADLRAADAVTDASKAVQQSVHANRMSPGMGFRRGLNEALRALSLRLVEIYAELEDVQEKSTRDELVQQIEERLKTFLQSSVASHSGLNSGAARRLSAQLLASFTTGVPHAFDLAVHEQVKRRKATESALPGANNVFSKPLVLFLSANPDPASLLEVEKEQNRVIKVRNASKHQADVRIECLPDLDLPEFAKSLRLHNPSAVHFSGHGAPDGFLLMRDENGVACEMAPGGLAKLLALQKDSVRLVVLNACFSVELADLLVASIGCVVGMSREVSDDAAILFSQSFYGALFDGASVGDAFETSSALVTARYTDESDVPVLRVRDGIDPQRVHIVK